MIEFYVFGETRIVEGDRVVGARELGGNKARQVLEILAMHAGHPVSKDRLIACLWGDFAPPTAVATLEAYVSVVRRHLAPGRPASESPLRTSAGGYLLDPSRVRIDLVEFHRFVAAGRIAAPDQARPVLRQALELATGELFESDPDTPWAVEARAAAQATLVQACADAGARAVADGSWADAIALARRALGLDPLAEACARVLIEALWRDGRRAEALRAYDHLRRTLADEMGVDPDRSTQDLHLAVLRDDVPAPGGSEERPRRWGADRPAGAAPGARGAHVRWQPPRPGAPRDGQSRRRARSRLTRFALPRFPAPEPGSGDSTRSSR